ncbi:ATP synthase subunit 6 (mitochondrion) [Pichia kudriavzevii]|uniref:ATP synthase subunit a n=1 Tax=Pichia kudriavzevii TaxID=4909 RepID=A0A2U9RAK4_PICKU|nr:ATP synthase subunit 6 [Pichia kudriavzevii]
MKEENRMSMMFMNSPLEQFKMNTFMSLSSPMMDLSAMNVTTFSLYMVLVLLSMMFMLGLGLDRKLMMGSNWLMAMEATVDTMVNMVKGQMGGTMYGRYVPLIYTLFMFMLMGNLMGMMPYNFAMATSMVFIISMSLSLWMGLTMLGLYLHNVVFFSLFVPVGTPLALVPLLVLIELLSYSARAISLGLRLAANTLSGHLLMSMLGNLVKTFMGISKMTFIIGLLPIAGIFAIVILEFAISCMQAYVFAILTSSYLKDSLFLH